MLLVLDNCEHLLQTCAELATALLRTCENLSILATSREPLGVSGEVVYSVRHCRLPTRRILSSVWSNVTPSDCW